MSLWSLSRVCLVCLESVRGIWLITIPPHRYPLGWYSPLISSYLEVFSLIWSYALCDSVGILPLIFLLYCRLFRRITPLCRHSGDDVLAGRLLRKALSSPPAEESLVEVAGDVCVGVGSIGEGVTGGDAGGSSRELPKEDGVVEMAALQEGRHDIKGPPGGRVSDVGSDGEEA